MVGPTQHSSRKDPGTDVGIFARFWRWLESDISDFISTFSPVSLPKPGLYHYRLQQNGYQRRIHLRVEVAGKGLLFADACEPIHLNPTATLMAKLALDGVDLQRAIAGLRKRYPGVEMTDLTRECQKLYEIVESLLYPHSGCQICSLKSVSQAPLFSVGVSAPYKVDLALTYGCNNHCGHCYNEPDRQTTPSMSLNRWLLVLEKLAIIGIPHIIFTGGEPSLHPDLPTLVAQADQLGLITGLNTNGRLLADHAFTQRLFDAGLNHVQITLGSCRPHVHNVMTGADSFQQTVDGIRNALAVGLHTITNTTMTRRNVGHAIDLLEFIHRLGVQTFAMNGMIHSGEGFREPSAIPDEELAPLLAAVRDGAAQLGMRFLWYSVTEYCRLSPVELEIGAKRCNAGEYSLCIEPNGDVLPCQSYYFPVGNILDDPWPAIWNSPQFLRFRERVRYPRQADLPQECCECPDLSFCGGGCPISRAARQGQRIAEQTRQQSASSKRFCPDKVKVHGNCSSNFQ